MKSIFLFIALLPIVHANADNPITGNDPVTPNSVETYTVNWDSWGGVFETYANVTWSVNNGSIIASDKHTVTIQWDDIPYYMNAVGSIEVYEDLGGGSGSKGVSILNYLEGVSGSCSGVLGSNTNGIDFGTGNNPGPALPAGQTTYHYETNCSSVTSGDYTIVNSTVGCNSDWLALTQDHTPNDVNGYMLLIDGDDHRGEVYRTTMNGLTDAFQYEFSVWVANLSNSDYYPKPKIAFELYDMSGNKIDGSGYFTIDYNANNPWIKVSFMFTLPPGTTSVQIVIVNDHNNPSGNDFVIDDIGFAPCYPPILASFDPNPSIRNKAYTCTNGTIQLYSWWPTPTAPFTNPSFKWQRSINNGQTWTDISGATSLSVTVTETTQNIYYYRILAYETSNPALFVVSNPIIYYVQRVDVSPGIFYVNGCTSSNTVLHPTYNMAFSDPNGPTYNFSFSWSPTTNLSDPNIINPTVSLPALPPPNPPTPPNPFPPTNYTYTLTVQNTSLGCSGSNTEIVSQLKPRKVAIFTAFTPNNDGQNDYFYPINIYDYDHFGAEFWIYNRWGQLVHYRNSGATKEDWRWDGTVGGIPQDPGVYVFMVRIPDCPTNYVTPLPYGVSYDNGIIKGNCTLIR